MRSKANLMNTATYQAPPPLSLTARLKQSLFSSPLDCVISLVCAVFFGWLVYWVIDWALLSSIWSAEEEALCRKTNGACWSVIDARHRIIFFGLFPFEEHWRSTLAGALRS